MEQVQYLVALRIDKRDYDLARKNKIKILEVIESNIEKKMTYPTLIQTRTTNLKIQVYLII